MAQISDLNNYREEPDVETMDRAELQEYLRELQDRIAALDETEPRNMNSEAYEEWGELHEELEDLVDEVLDLLDEM